MKKERDKKGLSLIVLLLFAVSIQSLSASKGTLVHTGKLYVAKYICTELYLTGGVKMLDASPGEVSVVREGMTKLTDNFHQDTKNQVFNTDALWLCLLLAAGYALWRRKKMEKN